METGALKGDLFLVEGKLAARSSRREEADIAFERAVQIYKSYDLAWDEARGYLEWSVASSLLERDGTRANVSTDLLQKSLSIWEPMGAGPWVERCKRLLA